MRYGLDDKFWVVTNPTDCGSRMVDFCFETSLRNLSCQFKGGLTADHNPTLFTDPREAEAEAFGRLAIMKALRALRQLVDAGEFEHAERVQLLDGNNQIVFQADLGKVL